MTVSKEELERRPLGWENIREALKTHIRVPLDELSFGEQKEQCRLTRGIRGRILGFRKKRR